MRSLMRCIAGLACLQIIAVLSASPLLADEFTLIFQESKRLILSADATCPVDEQKVFDIVGIENGKGSIREYNVDDSHLNERLPPDVIIEAMEEFGSSISFFRNEENDIWYIVGERHDGKFQIIGVSESQGKLFSRIFTMDSSNQTFHVHGHKISALVVGADAQGGSVRDQWLHWIEFDHLVGEPIVRDIQGYDDLLQDVAVGDGYAYVAGSAGVEENNHGMYLAKYKVNAREPEWENDYDDENHDYSDEEDRFLQEGYNAVDLNDAGEVFAAGSYNEGSDTFANKDIVGVLRKYNSDGSIAWTKQVHDGDYVKPTAVCTYKDYVLFAGSYGDKDHGYTWWLDVRRQSNGELVQRKLWDAFLTEYPGYTTILDMAVLGDSLVIVGDRYDGTSPGEGTFSYLELWSITLSSGEDSEAGTLNHGAVMSTIFGILLDN